MSLYNMINGVNQATFFFLPMLGKHPDEYPRFRDCFLVDDKHPKPTNILVLTRTGGGNRESYAEENEALCAMATYVEDYDDDFDSTYATWVFSVPDKWQADYDVLLTGCIKDVSEEYKAEMKRVFPKLEAQFDSLFSEAK